MATKIIKLNNGLSGDNAITYVPVTTTEAIQHSWGTSDKQQLKSYLGELKSAISTVASAELETRSNLAATYIKAGTGTAQISYNLPNGTYGLITIDYVEHAKLANSATLATELENAPSLSKTAASGTNTDSFNVTAGGKTGATAVSLTKATATTYGVVKLNDVSLPGHTHSLTITNNSDYTPTSDTVNVISYVTKPTAEASSWIITYTRASMPTKKYVDDTFVTKTAFNTFSSSGMHYRGDTDIVPANPTSGDVYHVTTKITSGLGTAVIAEVGDFITYYKPEDDEGSWSVWDKNVNGAMYYGDNTLTSGNILVPDGTDGKVKTQTIAQLGLATSSDITNMVTSANALTANAIVLGNGNKTVKTTTSYYPQSSATAFSATSDTQIPTSKSIAQYISGQSYLTAQDHNGKGAANRLVWWTDEDTHGAYTGNWGSSTKFAYIASGVLKEGTLPTGNKEGKNIVGASASATADAAVSTNGNVYLNHIEDGSVKSHHKITGASGINVTATDTGTTIKIEHSTATGYRHIPTGGAANQVLKYSASGTAVWGSLAEGLKYEIYNSTDDFTLDLGESTGSVSIAKTTF